MSRILGFDNFTPNLNESLFGSRNDPFLIPLSTDSFINGLRNKSMGDLSFYGPKIPFVKTTDAAKRRDDIIGDLQSLGLNDDLGYEIDRVELVLGYHFNPRVRDYGIAEIDFLPDFADVLVVVRIEDSEGDLVEEREIEVKVNSIERFKIYESDFNLPLFVTEVEINLPRLEEENENWLKPENWEWEFKIGYSKRD